MNHIMIRNVINSENSFSHLSFSHINTFFLYSLTLISIKCLTTLYHFVQNYFNFSLFFSLSLSLVFVFSILFPFLILQIRNIFDCVFSFYNLFNFISLILAIPLTHIYIYMLNRLDLLV